MDTGCPAQELLVKAGVAYREEARRLTKENHV
jgi:hypothetical protein